MDSHEGECSVDGGTANLDCDDRVQLATCCLKWLKEVVLVREHTEYARVNWEADTTMDVLLSGLEPRVCLRLLVNKVQETMNDD
jgi:hypothetical protein